MTTVESNRIVTFERNEDNIRVMHALKLPEQLPQTQRRPLTSTGSRLACWLRYFRWRNGCLGFS